MPYRCPSCSDIRRHLTRGYRPRSRLHRVSLVNIEDPGEVRHVILNRAEKRNSFNSELVDAVGEALRASEDDTDARVVVIRSDGPRVRRSRGRAHRIRKSRRRRRSTRRCHRGSGSGTGEQFSHTRRARRARDGCLRPPGSLDHSRDGSHGAGSLRCRAGCGDARFHGRLIGRYESWPIGGKPPQGVVRPYNQSRARPI